MSSRAGTAKKQGQKYQNKRKFELHSESKYTKRIQATPLDKLCQRCYDQIKWKMDYKKYKPLSQPAKCHECQHKCIVKAYRALCDPCALKKVEVRVPRAEAIAMGLLQSEEQPLATQEQTTDKIDQASAAAASTKPNTVAEQVIPEEANEEEETKEEATAADDNQQQDSDNEGDSDADGETAKSKATKEAGDDEADSNDDSEVVGAAAAHDPDNSDDEEGKDEDKDGSSADEAEDEAPKALTIPIQKVLNTVDPVVKTSRCSKCARPVLKYATQTKSRQQVEKDREVENERIMELVSTLKERMKRKVMRQVQNGEIDYDAKLDKLVYTDTKEEIEMQDESDVDSDDF